MNSSSYLVVVFGTLLAKVAGFARTIFFGSVYGTQVTADIYLQIFSIVTLVFSGIGVALSTRLIMNLNKHSMDHEKKKAYVASYLQKTLVCLLGVTAVLYLFSGQLTHLLLPNISPENFPLALTLTRIMLPSLTFVCVSNIMTGTLQNSKKFFIPSIVSIPYNILIISSLYIPGVSIVGVGIANTIGWFMHIIVQLPVFYRCGYRLFYKGESLEKKDKSKDLSIIWIFASNLMFQLCFIIDKAMVSGDAGMTATLDYASNLFVTISSIFVVAMSAVVFPSISKSYESGNMGDVKKLVGYMISVMFVIFIPFLLVVTLFGEQIIAFIYERGEFTAESSARTAVAFTIYSFGVLGYLAQELINKVLYLAGKYKYTLAGTVTVISSKLLLDYFFVEKYGTNFAAITTTVLLTLYAAMAFTLLHRIIGNYMTKQVLINIGKTVIAGICAIGAYYAQLTVIPQIVTSESIMFVLSIGVCGAVYLAVAFVLGLHKELLKRH